jgi:hypothetical protein
MFLVASASVSSAVGGDGMRLSFEFVLEWI